MKTKMILSLCLVLSLLLCACGAPNNQPEEPNMNVGEVLEETASVDAEEVLPGEESEPAIEESQPEEESAPTPAPEPETEPEPEPTQAPVVEVKNEFFNDGNNFYEAGNVSIRPRHMYWDGNVLVAQCFVINGLDTPVANLVVNDLDFSNGNGLIADAQFGLLQGVTLQPYSHVLWTFKFGADVVNQSGADLSSISYHSNVSFDH